MWIFFCDCVVGEVEVLWTEWMNLYGASLLVLLAGSLGLVLEVCVCMVGQLSANKHTEEARRRRT